MGAVIEEHRLTKKVTHLLAMNPQALLDQFGKERLSHFTGVSWVFHFSSSAFCTLRYINFIITMYCVLSRRLDI